jgi:hypothetical protein
VVDVLPLDVLEVEAVRSIILPPRSGKTCTRRGRPRPRSRSRRSSRSRAGRPPAARRGSRSRRAGCGSAPRPRSAPRPAASSILRWSLAHDRLRVAGEEVITPSMISP